MWSPTLGELRQSMSRGLRSVPLPAFVIVAVLRRRYTAQVRSWHCTFLLRRFSNRSSAVRSWPHREWHGESVSAALGSLPTDTGRRPPGSAASPASPQFAVAQRAAGGGFRFPE